MEPSNAQFAVVRVEGRRIKNLPHMAGHNSRTVAVRNADPAIPNVVSVPWEEFRTNGAEEAIRARIAALGCKRPPKSRHFAYEALLMLTRDGDVFPPDELFIVRSLEFCRREFGEETIVAWWLHADEKTTHVHVLGVPVCTGVAPGRPQAGEGRKKPVRRVSWHHFSGADKVNRRDPAKARTKADKVRAAAPRVDRNERLAALQTAWAAIWWDYGFRRGIPSSRPHLTPKWIRARTDQVDKMATEARDLIHEPSNWLSLSALELLKLRQNPTQETVVALIATYLPKVLADLLAPLIELAKRGVQLAVERQARADIAAAKEKTEKHAEAMRVENAALASQVESLKAETTVLKQEIATLQALVERPSLEELAEHATKLTDEEFAALGQARKQHRHERVNGERSPGKRPELPSPQPSAEQLNLGLK